MGGQCRERVGNGDVDDDDDGDDDEGKRARGERRESEERSPAGVEGAGEDIDFPPGYEPRVILMRFFFGLGLCIHIHKFKFCV